MATPGFVWWKTASLFIPNVCLTPATGNWWATDTSAIRWTFPSIFIAMRWHSRPGPKTPLHTSSWHWIREKYTVWPKSDGEWQCLWGKGRCGSITPIWMSSPRLGQRPLLCLRVAVILWWPVLLWYSSYSSSFCTFTPAFKVTTPIGRDEFYSIQRENNFFVSNLGQGKFFPYAVELQTPCVLFRVTCVIHFIYSCYGNKETHSSMGFP